MIESSKSDLEVRRAPFGFEVVETGDAEIGGGGLLRFHDRAAMP